MLIFRQPCITTHTTYTTMYNNKTVLKHVIIVILQIDMFDRYHKYFEKTPHLSYLPFTVIVKFCDNELYANSRIKIQTV